MKSSRLVVAGLTLALAAVILVVVHPSISIPATSAVNANSTGHVVEITGHAELAGGPMAMGEQSAGTHGYSGIIAVYVKSTATGTPVLVVPVSPKHDSYKLILRQSGTYYLVPQTPDGMQQAAPISVTAQVGQRKVVDVRINVP